MSKPHALRISAIAALLCTLNTPIHANRFLDEWHNFRTYPRIERAYTLLKQGDLAGARRLFEQVFQITPQRKDITFELARICARQADMACIDRLANSWVKREPNDATGYTLHSYVGYLTHNDTLLIKNAPLALVRQGAPESYRSTLAQAWLAALIRQNNVKGIEQAKQLLQSQNIAFTGTLLKKWEAERTAVQQALKEGAAKTTAVETKEETIATTTPTPLATNVPTAPAAPQVQTAKNSKPAIPANALSRSNPKPQGRPTSAPTRPAQAEPAFPYAELSLTARNQKLATHLFALAEQQKTTAFTTSVSHIKEAALWNAELQTALAKTLQAKHCNLLLTVTPVDSNPKATTPHSQMAAAFCSNKEPSRAAAHFAAVNQLHLAANQELNVQALRGEADALKSKGDTEAAMQRLHHLQMLDDQQERGRALAFMALQHPQFEISATIAKDFPAYFPAGALALQQARQAVQDQEKIIAISLYHQSLKENPDANVWYELALLHQREQQAKPHGEALAKAIELAPHNALFHAEYGFWLIGAEQPKLALTHLQTAFELDPSRIELKPQMGFLHMQLGQSDAAIIDLRSSIDQHIAIQEKMGISGDDATRQVFNWRRNVQTLEDRWNWHVSSQVRLNAGPDTGTATSPVQYGQYNGYLGAAVSYRLNPIWDAARPTWISARANRSLEDQSLKLTSDQLYGIGITQRILKDYMVIASAEWLHRTEATYQDDLMVRISGSHSINTDWQPVGDRWTSFNVYADAAWLARAESYYLTASVEAGHQFRLPWLDGKATFMPYVGSIATANNDNPSHTVVSRFDVGAGIALQTWHGDDPWRAPNLRQRLSLEVRQAIGGNTDDDYAVLLRWGLFH